MRKSWTYLLTLGLVRGNSAKHIDHANHIFNAIHDSMRQWGSSLDHNGMSFFLASVPEGTQFYHGTSKAERINGTEWLAFEPEHALVFARAGHDPPPPGEGAPPGLDTIRHGQDHHHDEPWHTTDGHEERSRYMPWFRGGRRTWPEHGDLKRHAGEFPTGQHHRASSQQEPLDDPHQPHARNDHGYLHTYRTKHELRLLYIDGQSAAKSLKGTLDTQDLVLLHSNPPPKDGGHGPPPFLDGHGSTQWEGEHRPPPPRGGHGPPPMADEHRPLYKFGHSRRGKPRPGGPMGESVRAKNLCEMAENDWQGRVDGFVRMELGFEIILCSFEKHLEVERISQVQESSSGGPPGRDDGAEQFAYYQAVASRFDGIGGDRVRLNYDSFVSLYTFPDAVYFDDNSMPRVRNDTRIIEPVMDALREMIVQESDHKPVDLQGIADLVVARYADPIEYLASGDMTELDSVQKHANVALRPFIDYSQRNGTTEIQRCAMQFMPAPTLSSNSAASAVLSVTTTICSALLDIGSARSLSEATNAAAALKTWLGWTTWKRCRGCGYHEVCFVPIWPMGGAEEHERPKCVSDLSEVSRGYWGDFRH